jgi:outer membrane receptor protein involved in Fe transport
VPNSNVLVQEQRVDAFVGHGWRFDQRWSFDWRLAGEYSRLDFSGDTNQVVTFAFAKPSLELTRQLGRSNQLRLRIFRDVGQLDFTDFVSSVSLTDERVEGGNPDLRPQTGWSAELSADLRFGSDAALSATGFHHWVSDTADYLPVGPPDALVDAPGNIGDARIYGLRANARVPLAGLRGATVTGEATWQKSEVTDPLTGAQRPISEFQDVAWNIGFRQDLPALAWGASYTGKSAASSYLLREIDTRRASPSLEAFIEIPLGRRLRLRAVAISLLDQAETRDRLFFDPDRRTREFSAERSERAPGRWYQLSLLGNI